ncbi:MAG TPA: response regulator [Candidatus Nitrosopolaris sp.]|nr:response regulator [Candidatus Nitrosopolaris sp.]
MASGIGSSPKPELAAALHRLRSTLARLKAEIELALADGVGPSPERLLEDVREALSFLGEVEDASHLRGAVLVVDDDARLADITARGLRRMGFDADSAVALRAMRAGEVLVFDLSLVDALDGPAYQQVHATRPIVVTGATDPASRALAAALGASDYLVKPVELEELAAAITRRMT